MKQIATLVAIFLMSAFAFASPEVGKKAPSFSVQDASGKVHKLSDYEGQHVVLEWYNKDCPYVRKHYDTGNMQKLQKQMKDKGVTWLTVISSAPGKQGYQSAQATLKNAKKEGSNASAILRDESGDMGRAYGAKTTPHMYVIDDKGTLRYMGAIDSNSSANHKTVKTAQNYVVPAVKSVMNGDSVPTKTSKPYGCSVKY